MKFAARLIRSSISSGSKFCSEGEEKGGEPGDEFPVLAGRHNNAIRLLDWI
jgi:hypothetical protein